MSQTNTASNAWKPTVHKAISYQVLYLLIQELSGIFLNVSLIQVGGEAH